MAIDLGISQIYDNGTSGGMWNNPLILFLRNFERIFMEETPP